MKKFLYRGRLNTYGDQTRLEEHYVSCTEKKLCNTSCMHMKLNVIFKDWFMEIDPPLWIAANFECGNLPVGFTNDVIDVNCQHIQKKF